ncbi:MAG TPA: hypothetical protein VF251_14625 [Pyrinomonadaceae bacterium]
MLAPIVLVAAAVMPALGQETPSPQLPAPPPLKVIPKPERDQIEAETGTKDRLKLTIQFALGHLETAERHTAQANYEQASAEVGMYHALIENALNVLAVLKRDSGKTRDAYKRLELALRAHGPRLTAMRRITPIEFAVWIKKAEDFAREGRTEALNSFYGHTVIREKNQTDTPEEKPSPTPAPKAPQL